MNTPCPRCAKPTPAHRFHCLHCNAVLEQRPLFDPDQPRRPLERWELWLAAWLVVVCATLMALIKMVWPWP